MTNYYTDSTTTRTFDYYLSDYIYSRNSTTSYKDTRYSNSTTSYSDRHNWDYFNSTCTTSTIYRQYIGTYYSQPEIVQKVNPSKEELLRQEEERIKAAEIAKKAREEAEEAARKARLLLTEHLDNENLQRLLNKQPLEVSSVLFSDLKYHIPISNGRIKVLKNDKIITELCLSVKDSRNLPTDDILLVKLLHVLHDEENMLRTANHFNKQENLLERLN